MVTCYQSSIRRVYRYVVCRNPMMLMEEERQEHVARLKKMESEMEQVFDLKVREKKQKMKDMELDVSVFLGTVQYLAM